MNYSFILFLAVGALATAQSPPNRRFIIKLKSSDSNKVHSFVKSHLDQQSSSLDSILPPDNVAHEFNSTLFAGFSGTFSNDFITKLNSTHSDAIDYVEEDHPVYAYDVQQPRAPWGLARISAHGIESQNSVYKFPTSAGQGVDVYVLDSGLEVSHADFEGRAKVAASFVQGEDGRDFSGHGTHVAGTIAGKTFGVAKKANVFGIKVIGKNGVGYDSNIIAGISYVMKNKRAGIKSVINLSLGGHKSRALDEAVGHAVDAGIVVVVAAGNDRVNACGISPAGAKDSLTVGATDKNDRVARFSNFGECVRMYAPGVNIASTSNDKGSAVKYMSGTSMASPHVAGVAALLMADNKYTSARQVMQDLKKTARPFSKDGQGSAMVMVSVPAGSMRTPKADEPQVEEPVQREPQRPVPRERRPVPAEDTPAPRQRRPEPSQDTVVPAPSVQVPAPRQRLPAPVKDTIEPSPLEQVPAPLKEEPSIVPTPDGRGSSWMDQRNPSDGADKKPCAKKDAPVDQPSEKETPVVQEPGTPVDDTPSDNPTTTVPPADNSTTLVPPTDNSTAIAPPADNSTALVPPVDDSTVIAPPADNSTTLLPPADNSTAIVPPVDDSTTIAPPADNSITIAPPSDESTVVIEPPTNNSTVVAPPADETQLDKACTDGAFKCFNKGFVKCDHSKWVHFQCAPGTECRQTSSTVILCDYPTSKPKKDCDTVPPPPTTNITLPPPLPSNNNGTNTGNETNATMPQLPGFEIPSTNSTDSTTDPKITVDAPIDTSTTVPVDSAQPIQGQPTQPVVPTRNPWDSSSESIITPATL